MGEEPRTPAVPVEGTYVVFQVGEGVYGLPTLVVREILGSARVLAPASARGRLRGSIDHRGWLVPVIGLRALLGRVPDREEGTLVMLVHGVVSGQAEEGGILIDRILGVVRVGTVHLQQPQSRGRCVPGADLALGVAETEHGDVVLLDACRLLSHGRSTLGARLTRPGEG